MSTELAQATLRSAVYGFFVRSQPIRLYAELQKQLRNDLRAQNPE